MFNPKEEILNNLLYTSPNKYNFVYIYIYRCVYKYIYILLPVVNLFRFFVKNIIIGIKSLKIFFNTLTSLAFPICGTCSRSGANSASCLDTHSDLSTGNCHSAVAGGFFWMSIPGGRCPLEPSASSGHKGTFGTWAQNHFPVVVVDSNKVSTGAGCAEKDNSL